MSLVGEWVTLEFDFDFDDCCFIHLDTFADHHRMVKIGRSFSTRSLIQTQNVRGERNWARHRNVRHDAAQKRVIESMCLPQQAILFRQNHAVQWVVCNFWRAKMPTAQCEWFLNGKTEKLTQLTILMNIKQNFRRHNYKLTIQPLTMLSRYGNSLIVSAVGCLL